MSIKFDFSQQQLYVRPENDQFNFEFGSSSPKPQLDFDFSASQPNIRPSNDDFHFDFSVGGGIEPQEPELPIKPPTVTMATSLAWHQPEPLDSDIAFNNETRTILKRQWLNHTTAPRALQQMGVNWETSPLISITGRYSWDAPSAMRVDAVVQWALEPLIENQAVVNWHYGAFLLVETLLQMQNNTPIHHHHLEVVWLSSESLSDDYKMGFTSKDTRQSYHGFKWGPHAPRWNCSTKYRPPTNSNISMVFDEPYSAYQGSVTIRFTASPKYCVYDDGGGLIDAATTLPPIDFKLPVEPQLRRAYIMQPRITCVRVSDNAAIIINSIGIDDNRGQFAAGVRIDFSSEIDAQRAANQLLKIDINGYEYYAYSEQPSSSHSFGEKTFSASGRSRVAELSDPYQLPVSYQNSTNKSLAGVLSSLIANTGWSILLNGISDFVVPAGAFSTSNLAPIAAVNDVASQLGCMLQCDDESKTITVMPRWPTVPWLYDTAEPDITLHEAVIVSHSKSESISRACNVCWLRGEQQGISAKVKRQGTAGDIPTSDISSQMILDNQAARVAGTNAIAETGRKCVHTMTAPIMADLPPLRKGMLVGVREGANIFKAVVDKTGISASVNEQGDIDVVQSFTLIESLE